MLDLFYLLALVSAFFDWKFIRNGGTRPTRKHYQMLGGAVALCVVLVVLLTLMAPVPGAVGGLIAMLIKSLFCLWELGRFRIRRASQNTAA
jgi:hypothetical protein